MPRPRLTHDEKEQARGQLDAVRDARPVFRLVAPIIGLPLLVAGSVAGYAALFATLEAILGIVERRAERAVNDPPRSDYRTQTQAQRPRIYPERAMEGLELSEVGVPAAEALRQNATYLGALVRSLERAQGAAEARDQTAHERRLREVYRFMFELQRNAPVTASALGRLADELRSDQRAAELMASYPTTEDEAERVRVTAVPTDELRRRLRAAGVKAGLEEPRSVAVTERPLSRDHLETAALSLDRIGHSIQAFAAELEEEGLTEDEEQE